MKMIQLKKCENYKNLVYYQASRNSAKKWSIDKSRKYSPGFTWKKKKKQLKN